MKFKYVAIVSALLSSFGLSAQDQVAQKYGALITTEDLKENLSILASDAMEGRETGKRGQKMAAAFVMANFQDFGLTGPVDGSYYQKVELFGAMPGDTYIKIGNTQYKNLENIVYWGSADSNGEQTLPVVFAGKGRKEDLEQVNVEGKAVLLQLASNENSRGPAGLAREKGAKLVLVFNPNKEEATNLIKQYKGYLGGEQITLGKRQAQNAGLFLIAPDIAYQILNTTADKLDKAVAADASKGPLKKIKPGSVTYKTSMSYRPVESANVLGFLEGTDKKDEIIVISSHYDHIGKLAQGEGDRINNGADDDGSGTVSVIQIAKAFTQAKKEGKGPRRSILFLTVTGEEKGLLGSEYYSEHPVFPLDKTVVDLNIDMVGRRDPEHKDSAPYVYVIGADKLSSELHKLNEANNKTYSNLIFDYTYNDEAHPTRLYYRSDHWNFAKKNIPIIFFFDGIHEDYHKPSDEVSKIEFDLLQKRAQHVFYVAWDIANRDQRIVPDVKPEAGK